MNNLKIKASNLPESPGVYIMKDADKKVIYVGKAKVLKRRVSQYFMASHKHSDKVIKMVSNIEDFDYIITDSEFEALVLECSLIKRYKPKYNILLKDDKGYSYIKITDEEWPRVLYVKQRVDDGSLYFGPYVNSFYVKNLVQEVINIFKLPICRRNFSKVKSRPCLNYHINKCIAPCCGNMSVREYKTLIDEVISFIKNGSSNTIEHLNEEIQAGTISPFSVAVFDVNNLKKTNDKYGHETGDTLICDAARLICTTFTHSPVYRIGGDEFAVILLGADYFDREKIFSKFKKAVSRNRKDGNVVVAGGYADFIFASDKCVADAFSRADEKMYENKKKLKKK